MKKIIYKCPDCGHNQQTTKKLYSCSVCRKTVRKTSKKGGENTMKTNKTSDAEQIFHSLGQKATDRVMAKLKKYLMDKDYTDGQKLEMLHELEKLIDEAY